jgi:hypothetical protein
MANLRLTNLLGCATAVLKGRSALALSRAVVVTTALTLTLLPRAAPVLAGEPWIDLAGTEQSTFSGPAAQQWTSGQWTQIRDQPLTGTFAFSGDGVTLTGPETRHDNAKIDFATGDGYLWGTVTYTDLATGMTCSGERGGKLTHFHLTGTVIARCSNGALLRGNLQDTVAVPGGVVESDFHGVLLSPD